MADLEGEASEQSTDPIRSEIGRRLAAVRESRGLTQRALGERIGKAAQAISRYERGVEMPGAETLRSLASELRVSSDYILGIGESMDLPRDIAEVAAPLLASAGYDRTMRMLRALLAIFSAPGGPDSVIRTAIIRNLGAFGPGSRQLDPDSEADAMKLEEEIDEIIREHKRGGAA